MQGLNRVTLIGNAGSDPEIQILEEEKVELAMCLDGSNLSIQELQGKNVEHSERERMLEEEVGQWQVEVQRLEEEIQTLSTAHDDLIFPWRTHGAHDFWDLGLGSQGLD